MSFQLTKAMILAAGFGTRLKHLSLTVPKALVKFNGTPMIELVLKRLINYGIKEVVINTHHFAEQIEKYFADNDFGIKINLIFEKKILGTGGGIKNAGKFLNDVECFFVHNVDVLSDINFSDMYDYHNRTGAFATLAVQERHTSRPLIIDEHFNVIGLKSNEKLLKYTQPAGNEKLIAFNGLHLVSSDIFSNFKEGGFFDIFTAYCRLIKKKKKIIGYDIRSAFWKDMGVYNEKIHS
ncbi:MAG: nucleotidyltransferase family protein [Ignavibacteria bacterium]